MTDIEMTETPAEEPPTEEPTTEEPTCDVDPYCDGWHGEGWCSYYSFKSLYVINGIFSFGSTNGIFSVMCLNTVFCIFALNSIFSIFSLVSGKIMANWKKLTSCTKKLLQFLSMWSAKKIAQKSTFSFKNFTSCFPKSWNLSLSQNSAFSILSQSSFMSIGCTNGYMELCF